MAGDRETLYGLRFLTQHTLNGFGGLGEGMSMQAAPDGRRILWLAHEDAPKNFTGVDVTDPKKPAVIVQTDLPHMQMRSNSLETVGDIMAVAYQVNDPGMPNAGMELFDISKPENPRSIAFFDCTGPQSIGVHQLWFCDGEFVHMAAGSRDFQPRHPNDHQFYRCIDVRDLSSPKEVGRWWLPGTHAKDSEPEPTRLTGPNQKGFFRAHNTNVYPRRPDRLYLGYIDAGLFIMDISDKSAPKPISNWNNSPPYNGWTHTVMPLFERELLVVTQEAVRPRAADYPKLIWICDMRDESAPISISTCPMPPFDAYADRGGRFGAHNIHENKPSPTTWHSEDVIFGTFFNGGLRAFDISNPFTPKEIAAYVPGAPQGSPVGAIQFNDVFVDDRGIVYAVDRLTGGLYILEIDF